MLRTYCLRVQAYASALHPFPTRRSSDLVDALESRLRDEALGCEDEDGDFRPSRARNVEPGARARRPKVAILDRKSTRLNSSHANISYAVFCLKKKTK